MDSAKRTLRNLSDQVRADPKNAALRLRLARLYRRFDNAAASISEYQNYLAQRPNDAAVAQELEAYRQAVASQQQP
jgi:predicted Zn-dependent protease